MAKMTLLELVQDILDAMDSDEVNSIVDTVESMQVARAVIGTYYELMAGRSDPSFESLIKLDSLGDPTKPNYMMIPDNVKNIKWIKYNGVTVPYRSPEMFLDDAYAIGSTGTLITDPDFSANYYIFTESDPTFWTTFDNKTIIFNGYDSNTDSTLQQSKTLCWGQLDPVFPLSDDAFAPHLSGDEYPGLLAEAKSYCFINFKQVSNSKEEQKSRRQRVRQQNDQWRGDQRRPYNKTPNYGRRGNGY